MNTQNSLPRAQWSSYYTYILVTTGAIVGLGNIFQFPFLVTTYGGLFVLFYIACEILISIPLLFAELLIGRRGKQNPVGAISILAMESHANPLWRLIGWLCFIILFISLSLYTVNVAFPLSYFIDTIKLAFEEGNASNLTRPISSLTTHFIILEMCFFVFLLATMIVIIRGINRGLEAISQITVPTYFLILFALAIYVCSHGKFIEAVNFLFHIPETHSILPVLFAALVFAFFKLNVGMGSMIVYGSYLPYTVPLAQSTVIIVFLDAIASLLSYFIICPLMLHSQVSSSGGLAYNTIVSIFASVPHGTLIASLFFFSAVIAAWTPTIAMAESAVLILIERCGLTRFQSVIIVSLGVVVIGTLIVLSLTSWSHIIVSSTWTIAGFIQNFASDFATPICAFLIAIFCGWIIRKEITSSELRFPSFLYKTWRSLLRFVIPICILVVFIGIAFN